MHRLKLLLAVIAATGVCAAAAEAAGVSVLWLATQNHTPTNRKITKVDQVVVHVTEGSFWGSVRWLRNRASHGSSHYVVSRKGEIVQLVSTSDIAWHAGNKLTNIRSVGIEHEGWTKRGGFTEAQYRASARLVAWLAHRSGMALDRKHVIGHDEVPHPSGRGVGGIDHHTDPGKKWDWKHYMDLIREFSKEPVQPTYVERLPQMPDAPPLPGSGTASTAAVKTKPARKAVPVQRGATVKGVAPWWSGIDAGERWRRGYHKVEFFVDGKLLWTDRVFPFAFRGGKGWDTRTVADGRHMLSMRLHGRNGYRVRKTIPVRVDNPPMKLEVTGLGDHGAARGEVVLTVRPNEPIERVALYVGGKAVSRDATAPYQLRWNSESAEEGPAELLVYARSASGRRAALTVPVVVANADDLPDSLDVALGGEQFETPPDS